MKLISSKAGASSFLMLDALSFLTTAPFAIFFSSLSLILARQYGFKSEHAGIFSASFLALHYMLAPVGNQICRWSGEKYLESFLVAKLFSCVGIIFLSHGPLLKSTVIIGFSLVLVDSMVSIIALQTMVSRVCDVNAIKDSRPRFLSMHRSTNAGFVIGILLSGIFIGLQKVNSLLDMAAFLNTISLITGYLLCRSNGLDIKLGARLPITLSIAPFCIAPILYLLNISDSIRLAFAAVIAFTALLLARSQGLRISKIPRKKLLIAMKYTAISLLFWIIYMLEPAFFPQFIDKEVDTIFLGIRFPPHVLQIAPPIFVMLQTSFIKKRLESNSHATPDQQASGGLIVLFVAIGSISAATFTANGAPVSFFSVLIALFFLSLSESSIAPLVPSIIADNASDSIKGLLLSLNRVLIGASAILSAIIINKILILEHEGAHLHIQSTNAKAFMMMAMFPLALMFTLKIGNFFKSRSW